MRPLAYRLSVGCVALMFVTMGGARGMNAHPLSSHGSHFGHMIAVEAPSVSDHGGADHSRHHAGPSDASDEETQEGSSSECTCVGPCQSGSSSNVAEAPSYQVVEAAAAEARPVAQPTRLFYRDPTAYLLPLPNAPPARV